MRVELRGVVKRYGKQAALDGVDLDIEHGERVALVGPNGSGKSTLIRVMMGLLAYEGTVLLDARSPFHHRREVAHRLAYVPQIAPALGATVGEIVRAVCTLRGFEEEAVRRRGEPLGIELDAIRDRPFRALSGGMKQKTLIALAFAAKPSLLILDEPTASLDAHAREAFVSSLDEVARDATVILCSHRPEEVQRLVRRVVELVDGKVARDFEAIQGASSATRAGRAS